MERPICNVLILMSIAMFQWLPNAMTLTTMLSDTDKLSDMEICIIMPDVAVVHLCDNPISGQSTDMSPNTYHGQSVLATVPLHSATSKTWVSTLEFHRYPILQRSYNYFRFGKGQFPFPVSCQCRAVSAVAPLD